MECNTNFTTETLVCGDIVSEDRQICSPDYDCDKIIPSGEITLQICFSECNFPSSCNYSPSYTCGPINTIGYCVGKNIIGSGQGEGTPLPGGSVAPTSYFYTKPIIDSINNQPIKMNSVIDSYNFKKWVSDEIEISGESDVKRCLYEGDCYTNISFFCGPISGPDARICTTYQRLITSEVDCLELCGLKDLKIQIEMTMKSLNPISRAWHISFCVRTIDVEWPPKSGDLVEGTNIHFMVVYVPFCSISNQSQYIFEALHNSCFGFSALGVYSRWRILNE